MQLVFIVVLSYAVHVGGIPAFACNFESGTWCEMENGVWLDSQLSLYNFTLVTGQTAPDKDLAPATDHTYNSSSGHFLYWHRPSDAIHTSMDGLVSIPMFVQRKHMCLTFAYYVKSSKSVNNETYLSIHIKGCYTTMLWSMNTDDTQGWKTAETELLDETCNVTIWFDVSPSISSAVSVALDDIVVDTCPRFITTTTPAPTGKSIQLTNKTCFLVVFLVIQMTIVRRTRSL